MSISAILTPNFFDLYCNSITTRVPIVGTKGDKGDAGINGIKGDPGTPGTAGAKGDQGDPGILGLGPVGMTPNVNALSYASGILNVEPANLIFGGVLDTTAQTIAGAKTFDSDLATNSNLLLPTTSLTVGTVEIGGSAFMHNFGPAGGCVNLGLATGNIDASNVGAQYNTAIGDSALSSVHTVTHNCAMGTFAASSLTDGTDNVFIGYTCGENLLSGSSNTIIGANAGVNYVSNETSNILINHPGVVGDSNTLRLGNGQTKNFIAGINGVTVTNPANMVVCDSVNNQLGTMAIPSTLTIGAPSGVANANGLDITGTVLTAHLATDTSPGLLSAVSQSIAGVKSFEADILAQTNVDLVTTTATTGIIKQNNARFLHSKGTDSVYVGQNAGTLTTTASNNAGIGQGALGSITTGGQNTAVGTLAGSSLTTESSNILVGFEAGVLYFAGESANIVFGNNGVSGDHNTIRLGDPAIHSSSYQAGIFEGAAIPDGNHPQLVLIDPTDDRLATNSLVYRDYMMGGLASQNSGNITAATVNGVGATISGAGFLTGNTIRVIIMGKQVTVIFPAWVVTANSGVATIILFTALSPALPLPYNTSASYNIMSQNVGAPVTNSYVTVDALGGLSIQFAATLVTNYGNTAVSSFTYISQ